MSKQDDWQEIETAPKDGTVVWVGSRSSIRLAFWRSGKEYEYRDFVGGGWRDHGGAERGDMADLHFTPTHWMDIPQTPIAVGDQR